MPQQAACIKEVIMTKIFKLKGDLMIGVFFYTLIAIHLFSPVAMGEGDSKKSETSQSSSDRSTTEALSKAPQQLINSCNEFVKILESGDFGKLVQLRYPKLKPESESFRYQQNLMISGLESSKDNPIIKVMITGLEKRTNDLYVLNYKILRKNAAPYSASALWVLSDEMWTLGLFST